MNTCFLWQDKPATAPAPAAAPAAAPQTTQPAKGSEGDPAAAPKSSGWMEFMPFILIFVVFWFLLIRPQRKQQKERERMLSNLKKNDHVLTSGGIYGIVDRIKDNEVILKIDEKNDIRVRVARAAVTNIEKVSGVEGEAKPDVPGEAQK